MFDKKVYIQRRKTLCEKVGSGIILLLGNDESAMNFVENPYHFRQDSTFLYYFGINFPGLAAIIDIDHQQEIIFGNDYTIDDIVWMGPQPTIAERALQAGVNLTKSFPEIEKKIAEATLSGRTIHFLPTYRPEHLLKLSSWLNIPTAIAGEKASVPLIRAVVSQREIKSDEEIREIEFAVNVSVDMHIEAMKTARPGLHEFEVAARVYETAQTAGCQISFPIIATINGQTLHNHYHGNVLKSGDLFLLDAGAEGPMGYAGDLSSTFAVDARFTGQQRQIYEMSLQAHHAAVETLAPGVNFREVHFAACRSITESMKSIGLLHGDTEEILAEGVHALFMPCGTGHMMGLDVHDMESLGEVWVGYDGEPKSTLFGLKSLRLAKPLRAGHVFTIEPGIYFIPELMDKWRSENRFAGFINWNEVEKFRSFGGIRNEENFMITEKGAVRLGKKKPMTIEEVENIRLSAI